MMVIISKSVKICNYQNSDEFEGFDWWVIHNVLIIEAIICVAM